VLQTGGVPADGFEGVKSSLRGDFCSFALFYNYTMQRVTEHDTSLHSGSIDSVQTGEAKLHLFEAVDKG